MTKKYSEKGFWEKLANFAADAGKDVVRSSLKLYYAATGKQAPAWVQAVAYAALAYFISPVDVIPDITPLIGYSDDAGVLATAITTLSAYVTPEVTKQANKKLKDWFG